MGVLGWDWGGIGVCFKMYKRYKNDIHFFGVLVSLCYNTVDKLVDNFVAVMVVIEGNVFCYFCQIDK